jgi:protein SCO1
MKAIALQLLAVLLLAPVARADGIIPSMVLPSEYQNVGVEEHPNVQLPLDLQFLDENSRIVKLGDYFKPGRPVVLQLGYYGCPKLCDVISRALVDSSKQMNVSAGKDYTFVFVSINPAENAELAGLKRQSMLAEYDRPNSDDGFHCLIGTDASIKTLADTIGYHYHRVDIDGQFAHPAVLMVLTPDGRMSRYLYGIGAPTQTLELSLVDASSGKIGSSWDKFALLICCYDVATGKYTLAAERLMSVAAICTMLFMGVSFFWLFRHSGPGRSSGPRDPQLGGDQPGLSGQGMK